MVRKNMKNNEIYTTAMQLLENNITQLDIPLPVKVSFYLQKNTSAVIEMAKEIENTRNEILQKYGTLGEDGNYSFEDGKLEEANKELVDLFELDQEVPVYEISLDAFDGVDLTSKQVQAITYMIKEEE